MMDVVPMLPRSFVIRPTGIVLSLQVRTGSAIAIGIWAASLRCCGVFTRHQLVFVLLESQCGQLAVSCNSYTGWELQPDTYYPVPAPVLDVQLYNETGLQAQRRLSIDAGLVETICMTALRQRQRYPDSEAVELAYLEMADIVSEGFMFSRVRLRSMEKNGQRR